MGETAVFPLNEKKQLTANNQLGTGVVYPIKRMWGDYNEITIFRVAIHQFLQNACHD